MDKETLLQNAFNMPIGAPAYPQGPYYFQDIEIFVIIYESDPDIIRHAIPEPLEMLRPIVKFEFVRIPSSTGFCEYVEVSQIIPVTYEWEEGSYIHAMYTNVMAPVIGGREIWGFPKRYGDATFGAAKSMLTGTLDYAGMRIATGSMGYKFETLSKEVCSKTLLAPNFLLKIIPHVNGTPRICELVRYHLKEINIKGVWTGPCMLDLHYHPMAPVANFPVRKVISSLHIHADLMLPYGEVVYNYLQD